VIALELIQGWRCHDVVECGLELMIIDDEDA
jgi:hypothetical protein